MTAIKPTLYFDLGSPYAYLAMERVTGVLGVEPRLEPILVGGIFALRGHGSWAHTPERETRIREVEARAERYGLPAIKWPSGWPSNTLKAMRVATWAAGFGAAQQFALAAFRRAFAEGEDLSQVDVLVDVAASVGLRADELVAAIEDPAVKSALRDATDRAWALGVVGVPCIGFGEEIFYGDDRLGAAALRLKAEAG